MAAPKLFGSDYSVYVRIARTTLAEKGVVCELVPVDVFAENGLPPWYQDLHPFGRIPAFDHDGFRLYETSAITRYVDEAFEGPALQPTSPRDRARMNQLIGIIDSYAYPAMVWDVYVERVSKPREGKAPDEERIRAGILRARTCLTAIAEIMESRTWLAGDALSLADLHAAPVFAYFLKAPEGRELIAEHTLLADWWNAMSNRPSFAGTEPAG